MQHTNTKIITDTILFQYHIPLPTVSATDCLSSAVKQLQDVITKHTVKKATNEEKAIDTLWELLTASLRTKAHAKATLFSETICPSTNIAAPHTATVMPPAIPQQPNLYQHISSLRMTTSCKALHHKIINTMCSPEPISLLTVLCHPMNPPHIST